MKFSKLTLLCLGVTGILSAPAGAQPPQEKVEADGTVHVPAFDMPYSGVASKEARDDYVAKSKLLRGLKGTLEERRVFLDEVFFPPLVARQRARYAVNIKPKMIAGVYTEEITPSSGIAPRNQKRVLINLHGGGFFSGARIEGQAESIPVAAIGKIRIIAVDYRQLPKNKPFPDANEDVEAVYKALLKEYKPQNIGIYGCSAGAALTSQMIPWLLERKIPLPGAIGLFCGGGVPGGGDSGFISTALQGDVPTMRAPGAPLAELAARANSAVLSPMSHPEVMAKFPPTLFITGTRASEMSGVVQANNKLANLGVESRLHVWDGVTHGSFMESDLPESREAYDIIVKFFDKYLQAK